MDISDIIKHIKEGESETLEFKATSRGLAETACAFANTEGGAILVGISDDGSIKGASKKDEERVSNFLQGLTPPPVMSVTKRKVDGKLIIVIQIERMDVLVSLGSISYIRIGRSNRPLSITELIQRSVQLGHIRLDEQPTAIGPGHMVEKYVRSYLTKRENIRNVRAKGTLKENASRLKIIVDDGKGPKMSYAGMLFFTKDPQESLPSSGIRVIDMNTDGSTKKVKEFKGPLWMMADDVYNHLVMRLRTVEVRVGVARRKVLEYPEWPLREAIVNAIAHRNYAIDADIRIFLFPDRLVIRSPGTFPQGISPEDPEHKPINPLICQYLYDMGLIEKYGFGITRMVEETSLHPFCDLEITVTPAKVDVVFNKKSEKGLDDIDQKLIAIIEKGPIASSQLEKMVGLSQQAIVRRLRRLIGLGLIKRNGVGPSTRYTT